MATFTGKTVLITGASSGIGEGTAVHFAQLGARLALTGRSEENLLRVASLCRDQGSPEENVLTIQGDLNSETDRKKIIQSTVERYGGIDVLVNNAGTIHYERLGDITPEKFDELMETNCRSPIFLTKLAIPYLIQSKGSIVNTSSICGQKAMPEVGGYCISKAAFDMYTHCLALELAPKGVRVNAISPGTVVSNIARRSHGLYQDEDHYRKFLGVQASVHPIGRVGVPRDCSEAIAFLASDAAGFITGQILSVDGGRSCVSVGIRTDVKK